MPVNLLVGLAGLGFFEFCFRRSFPENDKQDYNCFFSSQNKVKRTDQQVLLNGATHCKQHVMAPHDIISALFEFPEIFFPIFTGEPGMLERYWDQNEDLFESLQMPDLDSWLHFFFVGETH